MLLLLLFCLVLSQIKIFFVYTESGNNLSELAYFRVLGTEMYEVYEISTKKNHLPSLPQPLCPKVPQKSWEQYFINVVLTFRLAPK